MNDLNQPAFMAQSRNCRVFPGEGVLPALPVAKSVFDIGFQGWASMEVCFVQTCGVKINREFSFDDTMYLWSCVN